MAVLVPPSSRALADGVRLPCGATLKNRVAKAAMSEHLASRGQQPSGALVRLSARWAAGGAGLLITGNVMVDRTHLESPANVVLDDAVDRGRLAAWAEAGRAHGTAHWVQINHPGRQTPRYVRAHPLAPSAVPPVDLMRRAGAFGPSRAMTVGQIEDLVVAFGRAAGLAQEAGFSGAQLHGAHGYLVSQFLSPRTNLRQDDWGGDLAGRSRFLLACLAQMRQAVGPDFPLSVKLNSADFQRGGFDEKDALAVLGMLATAGVDLVEISGGSYESQAMFDAGTTGSREAYFLDFARRARQAVALPLMVTGGFRSRSVMVDAVCRDGVDVVGMARPFTEDPDVAHGLVTGDVQVARAPAAVPGLGRLGGVSEAMMSVVQMGRMGRGLPPNPAVGRWGAVAEALWREAQGMWRAR